jgi:PhzF family phenazine biosynthesis protein
MQKRPFKQVDVFTGEAYRGNPLAVVLDGTGLTDEAMQHFAHWTNLSETTFMLPPTTDTADYRVRIFTPGGELPFAGHPTLGTCHTWLQAGGKAKRRDLIVQECKQGLVSLRRDGERLAFGAPPSRRMAPSPAALAQVATALGLKSDSIIAARALDNGPVWLTLFVDDPNIVLALEPDHAQLRAQGHKVGIAARYANARDGEAMLEVRAFADPVGIPEDPVTGSLNASLAQWLIDDGLMPSRYLAAQGTRLGRAGRVHVERDDHGQVWVGGETVTCIEGTVVL